MFICQCGRVAQVIYTGPEKIIVVACQCGNSVKLEDHELAS